MPLTDERRAQIAALSGEALNEAVARAMGDAHPRDHFYPDDKPFVCAYCGQPWTGLPHCPKNWTPYATATGDAGWVLFGRMWDALRKIEPYSYVAARKGPQACGWTVQSGADGGFMCPERNETMARAYLLAKEAQSA